MSGDINIVNYIIGPILRKYGHFQDKVPENWRIIEESYQGPTVEDLESALATTYNRIKDIIKWTGHTISPKIYEL